MRLTSAEGSGSRPFTVRPAGARLVAINLIARVAIVHSNVTLTHSRNCVAPIAWRPGTAAVGKHCGYSSSLGDHWNKQQLIKAEVVLEVFIHIRTKCSGVRVFHLPLVHVGQVDDH